MWRRMSAVSGRRLPRSEYGCRAAPSLHVLLEVIEWGVEVWSHVEHGPFQSAELARLSLRWFFGDQAGNRLVVFGDDNVNSGFGNGYQCRQLRPSFFNGHGHRELLVYAPRLLLHT